MDYEWKALETNNEFDAALNSQVIKSVVWGVFLRDGPYMVESLGSTELNPADSTNFIPFDQVTNEQIMSWVKEKIGEAEVAKRVEIVNNLLLEDKARNS